MNDTFSFQRLWLFTKRHYGLHSKFYIGFIVIMTLYLFSKAIGFNYVSLFKYGIIPFNTAENLISKISIPIIAILPIVLGMFSFISISSIRHRPTSTHEYLIPISTTERYVFVFANSSIIPLLIYGVMAFTSLSTAMNLYEKSAEFAIETYNNQEEILASGNKDNIEFSSPYGLQHIKIDGYHISVLSSVDDIQTTYMSLKEEFGKFYLRLFLLILALPSTILLCTFYFSGWKTFVAVLLHLISFPIALFIIKLNMETISAKAIFYGLIALMVISYQIIIFHKIRNKNIVQ